IEEIERRRLNGLSSASEETARNNHHYHIYLNAILGIPVMRALRPLAETALPNELEITAMASFEVIQMLERGRIVISTISDEIREQFQGNLNILREQLSKFKVTIPDKNRCGIAVEYNLWLRIDEF